MEPTQEVLARLKEIRLLRETLPEGVNHTPQALSLTLKPIRRRQRGDRERATGEIFKLVAVGGPWPIKFYQGHRRRVRSRLVIYENKELKLRVKVYPADPVRWAPPAGEDRLVKDLFCTAKSVRTDRDGWNLLIFRARPDKPEDLAIEEYRQPEETITMIEWTLGRDGKIIGYEVGTGLTTFPDKVAWGSMISTLKPGTVTPAKTTLRGSVLIACPMGWFEGGGEDSVAIMPDKEELRRMGVVDRESVRFIIVGEHRRDAFKVLGLDARTATVETVENAFRGKLGNVHVDEVLGRHAAAVRTAMDDIAARVQNDEELKQVWTTARRNSRTPEKRLLAYLDEHGKTDGLGVELKQIAEAAVEARERRETTKKNLAGASARQDQLRQAHDAAVDYLTFSPANTIFLPKLAELCKQSVREIRRMMWVLLGIHIFTDGAILDKAIAEKIRAYFKDGTLPEEATGYATDFARYVRLVLKHGEQRRWAEAFIANRGYKVEEDGKIPVFLARWLWLAFGEQGQLRVWQVAEYVNREKGSDLSGTEAAGLLMARGLHEEFPPCNLEQYGDWAFLVDYTTSDVDRQGRDEGRVARAIAILKEHVDQERAEEATDREGTEEAELVIPALRRDETVQELARRMSFIYGMPVTGRDLLRFSGDAGLTETMSLPTAAAAVLIRKVMDAELRTTTGREMTVAQVAQAMGVPQGNVSEIITEVENLTKKRVPAKVKPVEVGTGDNPVEKAAEAAVMFAQANGNGNNPGALLAAAVVVKQQERKARNERKRAGRAAADAKLAAAEIRLVRDDGVIEPGFLDEVLGRVRDCHHTNNDLPEPTHTPIEALPADERGDEDDDGQQITDDQIIEVTDDREHGVNVPGPGDDGIEPADIPEPVKTQPTQTE